MSRLRSLSVSLRGDNLGERHRYLNSEVNKAAVELASFQGIEDLPELAPVDRLFKIDLANKLNNVDYILQNLKDDDMLYVSRALKCLWLVERSDIINPKYLEDVLYPQMVMPAITKMKHWLYINLREPSMCQQFYQYYTTIKFDYAVKFLSHCSDEYQREEFSKIMIKLTPHHLKVLCERNPKLLKIYYDSLATDNNLKKRYLSEEQKYYNSVKCVLKLEPDVFLDITEKYHSLTDCNKLSPSATEYILRYHKSRFMAKPELYVLYLLNIPTVARCPSVEECQDVVIRLARADFLKWWFSYANVEPMVKRISHDKRAAFKKRVFVEKDVGEPVAEWPYALPASPVAIDSSYEDFHVFQDQEFEPIISKKRKIMKKCAKRKNECVMIFEAFPDSCPQKSDLQRLFDEFRFKGFENTYYELKERVRTLSSADRRRDILIVLVSKTGGRTDAVRELLQLALSLRNEPIHIRAAVVRSLVKRASMWRLPQDVWDTMLEYAHDLGLDGTKSEAECREGLHAAVMRQLIATGDCEPALRSAFLDDFSTCAEYKLMADERVKIAAGLQNILVAAAADADPTMAANYLNQLLDVLKTYHIPIESSPAMSAIAELAERDFEVAKPLLEHLYNARVGRRELLRQYLKFRHDDAALLNALRHDRAAISPQWLIELLTKGETQATRFFMKLAVYFTENGGPLEQIRQVILETIVQNPNVKLAKPLAILAGSDLSSIWHDQDEAAGEHHKLADALRANMHCARPAPDALTLGWRKVGMKALAWRAMRCRPAQVMQLVKSLLEEKTKRTVRLALALAQRTDCAADIFSTAITIRPLAVLRAAILYYRSLGETNDTKIWDMVKPIMTTSNLTICKGVRHVLTTVQGIPKTMKANFCAILYLALHRVSDGYADYILRRIMDVLPEVSDDLLETVALKMLANMDEVNPKSYPAFIIRYLMLSKNDNEFKTRLSTIGEPFFNKLDAFRDGTLHSTPSFYSNNFNQVMSSLLYNSAFFDVKYECCTSVIETILSWMQKFMPTEKNFGQYVNIHSTILYYKAVRQSIKNKPEVFEDPIKKMMEGVEIVGCTFGRYIAKELTELMSKYFDSVIELYYKALVDFLNEYFTFGVCRENFTAAVIKGMLLESVGREARLAIYILNECQYTTESPVGDQIKELILKSKDNETQFFGHALIYG